MESRDTFTLRTLCLGTRVRDTRFLNIREFVVIFDKDMGGIIKNKIETKFLPTTWEYHSVHRVGLSLQCNVDICLVLTVLARRSCGTRCFELVRVSRMPIFFSVLNMYLTGLLFIWANQDMRKVRRNRLGDAREDWIKS